MGSLSTLMRHFSNTHGKHCYLRSFHTKCLKCKADVLYWECTHGCKVFFEYPPYGKLIRHRCRKIIELKENEPVVIYPASMLGEKIPSCPVCGKIFSSEKNLGDHILQLKKDDQYHKEFFKKNICFKENLDEKIPQSIDKQKNRESIKFGRINIKKSKRSI